MNNQTIKKLALCEAYEAIVGGDQCSQMEAITEETDDFWEWQNNLDNPEIKKYKEKIITFFKNLE